MRLEILCINALAILCSGINQSTTKKNHEYYKCCLTAKASAEVLIAQTVRSLLSFWSHSRSKTRGMGRAAKTQVTRGKA